jgi:hypothetical protein
MHPPPSKMNLQSHLNLSSGIQSAADGAENARVAIRKQVGVPEGRVIKQIEELSPQLDRTVLANLP